MHLWIAKLMIAGLGATWGTAAWAGQYTQQCQSATDSANQQCDGAIQQAKGVDSGNYASGMAAQGTNVNSNAVVQKPGIQSNDAAIGSAIGQCTSAKQQCSSQCQAALGQAQAALARGDMSAQSDVSQIPQIKSNQCEQQIQKKIDELQASKSPLSQKAQEAQDTKDASDKGGGGGGMPQMPQMPQSKDSSDSGSSSSAVTPAAALNCNAQDASRFSDCNTSFTTKCMSSMANAECDTFTDRYCNLSSGAAPPALSQATTNLVIDQKSEGLGSNYCNYALSSRYCQTSGRAQCPSCTQLVAQQQCAENNVCSSAQSSVAAVNALRTTCPDDPYYVTGGFTLTPMTGSASAYAASLAASASAGSAIAPTTIPGAVPSTTVTPASATGGNLGVSSGGGGSTAGGGSGGVGGGGGLGSGGGAAATAATAGPSDANREGLPNGIIPASAGGGGAGGAGDGDQSHDSSWTAETSGTAASVKAALDKRAPASTVEGLSNDVAATAGPSIFSIGSVGIQKFCARSQLTGCAK